MALMRWDPFGEVMKMQRDLDRIFSRTGQGGGQATMTTSWMPRINVKQSGEDLQMQVELAGIKPEDVDIDVTDGVLSLRGERKGESEREDEGWIVRESSYGSFERSMVLPEGIDPNSIQADFHDGMLDVRIPKAMKMMEPKTTKVAIGGTTGGQQQGQAQGATGQGQGQAQGQTETVQSPEMGQMGKGGTYQGGQGGMEGSQGRPGEGMNSPEMSGMGGQSPAQQTEEEKSRKEQPVGHRY